ncbi:MAG: DUF2497 domain-containing protein [Pseudomonadota bacterium]
MANPQPEPSMEEILASIRRIISDDEPGAEETATDPSSSEAEPSSTSPSVSGDDATSASPARLFEGVDASPSETVSPPAAPSAVGLVADQGADLGTPSITAAATDAVSDERPTYSETSVSAPHDNASGLEGLSDSDDNQLASSSAGQPAGNTAQAELAAFSAASSASTASAAGIVNVDSANVASEAFRSLSQSIRVSGQGDKTLEDIVTDLLTPLIKDWLDKNLPSIVEEKVQDEVQRIARRAR